MTTTMQAGTYTGRAVRWAWDTTKAGDLCLALVFSVRDAEGVEHQLDGRLYFDTDRPDAKGRTAAHRSLEALRAMGMRGGLETITDEGGGGLDAGDVELVVDLNDAGFPRVKFINAPRAGRDLKTFAPPSAEQKRAFFAAMQARLGSTESAPNAPRIERGPRAPYARPTGFASAQDSDDIPF